MRIFIEIIILIGIIVFLLDKNKFNFVWIYFFSSIIYYINFIFGEVYTRYGDSLIGEKIDDRTYTILLINFSIVVLAQIIYKFAPKGKKKLYEIKKKSKNYYLGEKYAINLIVIINFIIALYVILKFRLFSINEYDKLNILNNSSHIVIYFKDIALILYIYIFTEKHIKYNKLIYLIVIICMMVTFLLGHRSYIVIGNIAILINFILNNQDKYRNMFQFINKYKKVVLIVSLFGVLVYVIKGIYVALFTGQFDIVLDRLGSQEYYITSLKIAESNSIMKYINATIINGIKVQQSTYFPVIMYLIPFVSRGINVKSFSTIMEENIFLNSRKGSLGSSFIAEAIANGGFLLFIFILLVIIIILFVLKEKFEVNKVSNIKRCMLLLFAIEFGFYIHRNSLATLVIRLRSYIYIFLMILLVKKFFECVFKNRYGVIKNEIIKYR